jgi:hypothetical protein
MTETNQDFFQLAEGLVNEIEASNARQFRDASRAVAASHSAMTHQQITARVAETLRDAGNGMLREVRRLQEQIDSDPLSAIMLETAQLTAARGLVEFAALAAGRRTDEIAPQIAQLVGTDPKRLLSADIPTDAKRQLADLRQALADEGIGKRQPKRDANGRFVAEETRH